MAVRLQLFLQLAIVVDLAVEDHADALFDVPHRLVAAAEIDDREPPVSEPDAVLREDAAVVRAAVDERVVLSGEQRRVDGMGAIEIIDAANTAHIRGAFFGSAVRAAS